MLSTGRMKAAGTGEGSEIPVVHKEHGECGGEAAGVPVIDPGSLHRSIHRARDGDVRDLRALPPSMFHVKHRTRPVGSLQGASGRPFDTGPVAFRE